MLIFIPFLLGFLLSLLLTKPCLALLYKLKLGQKILDDTPENHRKKSGTPTMGGIIFIISIVLTAVIFVLCTQDRSFLREDYFPLVLFPVLMGCVGLADDYLTVHPKNGVRGIKSLPKAIIQAVITVAFVCWLAFSQSKAFNICGLHLTGIWYVIIVSFIITGYINFTNLTDGLDGLLAGIVFIIGISFGLTFYGLPFYEMFFFPVLAGMCLAFLVTNSNPAKVFMGDTGSLFLGAYLMALSFYFDIEWMVFIASGWIILEGFSVIIQWAYFKITKKIYGEGKRIFRCSPIHHHFEMLGYPEQKITVNAWIITVVLCMVAFIAGFFC
ncbi:MAG: phospho-N-acetylmuramoyl-pentapeptide-transferase [Armatimonadetes bacterium]|nr:phospho-N-acetylmuramoyl-pentapeptide-transferase [Candidatus Hippobium faecium]